MKQSLLLTCVLALAGTVACAQVDMMFNFNFSRPQQEMNTYMSSAFGINGQVLYLVPNTRLAVGADLGYSTYGCQSSRQTYRFTDGSVTETDVSVGNNIVTINLVGRMDLLSGGPLVPYLIGQAGYNRYFTDLTIADPNDADGCRPLANHTLLGDGALSVTGGAGLRWDLSTIIKSAAPRRIFIDFSAQYTQGGRVNYMNVNLPPSPPEPVPHHSHHHISADGAIMYSTRFINPQNQVIHEHHVGDVYRTPIQLLSYKLGFVYRIR
jgi:hypothetical protein